MTGDVLGETLKWIHTEYSRHRKTLSSRYRTYSMNARAVNSTKMWPSEALHRKVVNGSWNTDEEFYNIEGA